MRRNSLMMQSHGSNGGSGYEISCGCLQKKDVRVNDITACTNRFIQHKQSND